MLIYISLYCFFAFTVENVLSLKLISLGNANLPTIEISGEIDTIKYNKLIKNNSGTINLNYELKNAVNIVNEKITLKIEGKKANILVISKGTSEKRGQKIHVVKEVTHNNSILYTVLIKASSAETGKYDLEIEVNNLNLNATSYIYSIPIVKEFPKPKLGLEGDPMRITCNYDAYPEPNEIIWEQLSAVGNINISAQNSTFNNSVVIISNDRIKIEKSKGAKIDNNTLYITSLNKNDSGIYRCIVVSSQGRDHGIIKINVKDRWAALYPFIGIVIEVVLLVTAILAYEKYQIRSQNRKNYTTEAVDDDQNKEPGIPLATGGGDDENNAVTENDLTATEADVEKTVTVDSVKQREIATTRNV